MAVNKRISNSIKTHKSEINAIDYIVNDEKASNIAYVNCYGNSSEIAEQFQLTRNLHNKDNNIMAHHYVMSFSPSDNVTPEQANQLAQKLMQKIAPVGWQYVVSTHTDRNHIHTHILINSVNMITGKKWEGNKNTTKLIRAESDKICLQNGLSVIEKNKYTSVSQSTVALAKKGKSWVVQLCKDLDEAVKMCHSRQEFISFLQTHDYEINRYTNKTLTLRKKGENKSIRVDTLANQFGNAYRLENLESKMKFRTSATDEQIILNSQQKRTHKKQKFLNEFEKFEAFTFRESNKTITDIRNANIPKSLIAEIYKLSNSDNFIKYIAKLFFIKFLLSKRKRRGCYSKLKNKNSYNKKLQLRVAQRNWNDSQRRYNYISNIKYQILKNSVGENMQLRVDVRTLHLLINQPIFYSCRIDRVKGTADIMFKAKDTQRIANVFQKSADEIITENQSAKNKALYFKLKKQATDTNDKILYAVINREQLEKLQANEIDMPYFAKKDDKFNLAFLQSEKDKIMNLLYNINKIDYTNNSKINTELKDISMRTGEKRCYKLIKKDDLEKMKSTNIKFAYFSQGNLYNIVYLQSSESDVQKTLYHSELVDKNNNPKQKL